MYLKLSILNIICLCIVENQYWNYSNISAADKSAIILISEMKVQLIYILILSTLLLQCSSYAIEGAWKINEIQGRRLPQKHTVKAEIKDFIFRNSSIRWTITFSGCQSRKIMLDIQGKDLFLDLKTLFVNNTNILNCSQQLLSYQQRIQASLKRVFTFQIMSSFMIFTDPRGEVLFKFERLSSNQDKNLKGAWMVNEVKGKPFSQSLDISDQEFIFCQRGAKSKYRVLGSNKIEFKNQQNGTCKDQNLLNTFKSPLFLVKRKNKLELYNQNDQVLVSLFYMMNLESAKKFREDQQKAKKEREDAQKKIIEVRKRKDQERRLQIQKQEKQQKQRDKARLQAKNPNQQTTQTVTTQPKPFQISDFFGTWKLTKVVGTLPVLTNVSLVIAKDQIILTGDCKTFIMIYSMASQAPIKIKRESLKQASSKCNSEDQQMYKNGLNKISIFQIRLQKDKTILKLYDEKMKQVFEIEKNGEMKVETIKVVSTTRVVKPPPAPPKDLSDGKYAILLLSNLSSGRKILTTKNNRFTINACNFINVSYQISKQKKIVFKTKVEGEKKVCEAQDKLYIAQLQKGASIVKDGQDFIIQDSKGKDIITFNPI